ncbi:MAG: efflux RND transporter periplasmic adaptor subunit [Planctomycetota bacterium]
MTQRHFVTNWVAVAGASLALFFAGCDREEQAERPQPLVVATSVLGSEAPVQLTREYSGIVQPRRASALAAKEIGRVDQVFFDIGDRVEIGQQLVQLDIEQIAAQIEVAEASLDVAKSRFAELKQGPRDQEIAQATSARNEALSNLNLAKENFKRLEKLQATQAISEQELDEVKFRVEALAESYAAAEKQLELLREGTRVEQIDAQQNQVKSLEAQLKQLQVRLSEKSVFAPYPGIIQSRWVDEGDVVAPGQILMDLVESDFLEIHVGLPPELCDDLKLLQDRSEIFKSVSDKVPIEAKLSRVSPVLDATSRTRKCVFEVREASGLRIGDSVRVVVEDLGGNENSSFQPWVPTEALVAGPRGLWAILVPKRQDESTIDLFKLESRPVEVLRVRGGWSQIRGTVKQGEPFVHSGAHRVVPGQIVTMESLDERAGD